MIIYIINHEILRISFETPEEEEQKKEFIKKLEKIFVLSDAKPGFIDYRIDIRFPDAKAILNMFYGVKQKGCSNMILEINYEFLKYMCHQNYYRHLDYLEMKHIAYSYEDYGNLSIRLVDFSMFLKRKNFELLKGYNEHELNVFHEEVNDFFSNCTIKLKSI